MRVAIVGCGLIGNKRAKSIAGGDTVIAVADKDAKRAQQLSAQCPRCEIAETDWEKVVGRPDVEAVVVATTNDMLAPVTTAAVKAGKHVLVEKPAARSSAELALVCEVARAAAPAGVVVKVGFNHRFHPALMKARELVDAGALGPLMFVRGRYGQGGRKGMEREWRGSRQTAGGGEMLDQGVHLIDLSRWFLGDFTEVSGHVARFFWNWEVEDNGFALCRTAGGQVAWLHASCTEWKNMFSLEIYGRDGKIAIDGLGGSYGVERITFYKMLPEMGPPETTTWEYPFPDRSWDLEWADFTDAIRNRRRPNGDLHDALAALRVIGRLYADSPPIAPPAK